MKKANTKLWGGRFSQRTESAVDDFNASISFDYRLYPYDIAGSIAHARMLAKQGIIKKSEGEKIVRGLKALLKKIDAGKFRWEVSKEDVHLNIESELTKIIGPVGGKLHTARSRNDQVATDLRLYCRDHAEKIRELLRDFQSALLNLAEKNVDTLLPGYTHLQRAQPISLAHQLLAYFEMAGRDYERLNDALVRINVLPLGSGALAGTTFPIDREAVAKELGFTTVCRNSLDGVSDRDFVVEFLSALSLIMTHLSRLSEDFILWATQEFQFVALPEDFCTGSSMMPQKINPDVLELVRGKAGRVYGSLITLLTVLKGLPLTYNKDLQEDKEPLFDAVHTVESSLSLISAMLKKTRFRPEKMRQAMAEGFVLATDLADYLVTRGLPFREAHHVVGKIVAHCQQANCELKDLKLDALKKFEKRIGPDVFDWLEETHSVDRRATTGGTARKRVHAEIRRAKKLIKR